MSAFCGEIWLLIIFRDLIFLAMDDMVLLEMKQSSMLYDGSFLPLRYLSGENYCVKDHWVSSSMLGEQKWGFFGKVNGSGGTREDSSLWMIQVLGLVHESLQIQMGLEIGSFLAEISSVKDHSKLELNTTAKMASATLVMVHFWVCFPQGEISEKPHFCVNTKGLWSVFQIMRAWLCHSWIWRLFHCKLKQCQLFHLEFC